jgi:hypothetical protein
MDKKQKEKEKRETPIVDGDARPDMPTDPTTSGEENENANDKNKFESERASDLNSLEDYKDAKQ